MNRIKNILVLLDLTYIDPVIVKYAGYFAEIAEAGKVEFLHVIQEYDLPDKGGKELPDDEELYKIIYDKIHEEVHDHFGKKIPLTINTRIESEDASAAIIEFISYARADLLLIGQKFGASRQSRYGHKIASGADCDIMYVPEMAENSIKKILCAIDCSKESETAFKRALSLAEKTGAALACHFLYDTTQTYFPATTTASASMKKEGFKKEFARFLERFEIPPGKIECHFKEVDPAENQADKTYESAKDEMADLIIVGAAGSIASSTSVLGNMLENFNHMELKIPLLIIKNKKSKRFFLI